MRKRSKVALFMRTVPCGFCTLLAVFVVITVILVGMRFKPVNIRRAGTLGNSVCAAPTHPCTGTTRSRGDGPHNGIVSLLVPVMDLMVYYMVNVVCANNFFDKASFMATFSRDSTSIKLILKDFFKLIVAVILCLVHHIVGFESYVTYVPSKFGTVMPTVLVLAFT